MQRIYVLTMILVLTLLLGTSTITPAADVDQLLGRVAGVAPALPQPETEQAAATAPTDPSVLMAYG
jgi:hypothetical protein